MCSAWFGFSFGSLAWQLSLGFGDLHPFSGGQPDQIGLELRNHREHVGQEPSDGIGGVVNRAVEAELDVSCGQLSEDVAGIGQRAGELVQFRDHEGVARSTGGERQPKTWPVPVRAVRPWST
jgi:hypothetical protein